MSFTLPLTISSQVCGGGNQWRQEPLSESKPQHVESDELIQRQKEELEGIVNRQKERIRALRTSATIEVETYEKTHRAQLLKEENELEDEMVQMRVQLDNLNLESREVREENDHELQCGEMRSNLAQAMRQLSDLQEEVKDSERQLNTLQSIISHSKEKAQTVREELQQTRQHVKWLLECQVADEQAFKSRIREEEAYLQKLTEARDDMQKETHQLKRQEELEILPLQEDAEALEEYLEEMQKRTCHLEIQCEELRQQEDDARRTTTMTTPTTDSSDEAPSAFSQKQLLHEGMNYVDQFLKKYLEEELNAARLRNESPISVAAQKEQWLQNYHNVWSCIYKQCEELLREIKSSPTTSLNNVECQIKSAQERLDEVTGRHSGESLERRTALLAAENLMHLIQKRQKAKAELLARIEESAANIGESSEPYILLTEMDGYEDIIDEENDETVLPNESHSIMFDIILEETPEEAANELRSMADIAPEDKEGGEKLHRTAHRARGCLQEFLQQKSLFLSEMASRAHVSLRRVAPKGDPPDSVEKALSQNQEKLLDAVVGFVKTRRQKIMRGQLDPREETVSPDPEYHQEAEEMHSRIEQLLSDERSASSSLLDDKWRAPSAEDSTTSQTFHRITVDGARLPHDVVGASIAVQTKYFLSCVIRGFTAVMLTPNSTVPCVRHLFLSRDLTRFHAREVVKSAMNDIGDVVVNLCHVCDILLPSDARLTTSKLKPELSFIIMFREGKSAETYWVVQADNNESRRFWAYVLAWIVNETATGNKTAVISAMKATNKLFVLDTAGTTADTIEPSERHHLYVKVDET